MCTPYTIDVCLQDMIVYPMERHVVDIVSMGHSVSLEKIRVLILEKKMTFRQLMK